MEAEILHGKFLKCMLLPLKEIDLYRLLLIDNKGSNFVCKFKPQKNSSLGALLTVHVHDILLLS